MSEPKGGDVRPVRLLMDPYPVLNGLAVDAINNIVVASDMNKKSLLIYDRLAEGDDIIKPKRHIIGPRTMIGYVAGVALDPHRGEIYAVNNDIEDTMMVFNYEDDGNAKPTRALMVPHRAWGISIGEEEIAISVQTFGVVVFKREASGIQEPKRSILGINSWMADPHGIVLDEQHDEIIVANHGNWNYGGVVMREEAEVLEETSVADSLLGGKFLPPSINFYDKEANGDVPPIRSISGPKTQLNWPMAIHLDQKNDEIAVANNGDDSVLIFRRSAEGDVSPIRVIRGDRTGIKRPVGVAIDDENNELWVANFGDHSILVFDRLADGNVKPKRVIRTAPRGTPCLGFGNPMAATYDTRRGEIIIANCVTQPRIYAFPKNFSGVVSPRRVVECQRSKLGRTMHGIAYNPVTDEIVVCNPLAAAVMFFRADADGEEPPLRIIQGRRTRLAFPHSVSVDVKHQEIYVGDPARRSILVYPCSASGEVEPIREIRGPKTLLDRVVGAAVDHETDSLVVATTARGKKRDAVTGLVIFNRLDNGNVSPKGFIAGPNTGIKESPWQVYVFNGRIYVAITNSAHRSCFRVNKCVPTLKELPPSPWRTDGFVAVWDINDRGDIPPRFIIKGNVSELCAPSGFAINPIEGELYVSDSVKNCAFVFHLPEFFRRDED